MNRRSAIYLIGGLAVGGGGYSYHRGDWGWGDVVGKSPLGRGNSASSNIKTQQLSSSLGFEKIEFKRVMADNFDGWIAAVTFGANQMDAFGVRHTSTEPYENDIWVCHAPVSIGSREVPIARALKKQGAVYPDRRFYLSAYNGLFNERDCGTDKPMQSASAFEVLGNVEFTIPSDVAPQSNFPT